MLCLQSHSQCSIGHWINLQGQSCRKCPLNRPPCPSINSIRVTWTIAPHQHVTSAGIPTSLRRIADGPSRGPLSRPPSAKAPPAPAAPDAATPPDAPSLPAELPLPAIVIPSADGEAESERAELEDARWGLSPAKREEKPQEDWPEGPLGAADLDPAPLPD